MSLHHSFPALHIDPAGVLRPDLIPLAAFLCSAEYDDFARAIILDHAAADYPLEVLTHTTPDGWIVLDACDLEAAEEALAKGREFADVAKRGMQ